MATKPKSRTAKLRCGATITVTGYDPSKPRAAKVPSVEWFANKFVEPDNPLCENASCCGQCQETMESAKRLRTALLAWYRKESSHD
jgi:hypothetical protein